MSFLNEDITTFNKMNVSKGTRNHNKRGYPKKDTPFLLIILMICVIRVISR